MSLYNWLCFCRSNELGHHKSEYNQTANRESRTHGNPLFSKSFSADAKAKASQPENVSGNNDPKTDLSGEDVMRILYWNWNREAGVMRLLLALVFVAMTFNIAIARPIPTFDYRRLFEESDVVVIATVVKTDDTDDKFPGQEDKFKGQNTEFNIEKVIQGKVDGEKFQLLHFKYVGRPPANGPNLVTFEMDLETEGYWMSNAEYMLFLKRTRDGRYVPVSGQYDSEISVKVLASPDINKPGINARKLQEKK